MLQQVCQCLGIDGFQPVDLHPINVVQQTAFAAADNIDLLDRLFNNGHLIRRGLSQNHVLFLIQDQPGFHFGFGACCSARGTGLRSSLLHLLLHLLHHLHHHVGIHSTTTTSSTASSVASRPLQFQQLTKHLDDVIGSPILQMKRADQLFFAILGLFRFDQLPQLSQADRGIDDFQTIGAAELMNLPGGTEHRLEFFDSLISNQPVQIKRHFAHCMIRQLGQHLRGDSLHHRRIEFFDFDDRHDFAGHDHRETTTEQMPVDQIASFLHGVFARRDQIERIARKFLPVERQR